MSKEELHQIKELPDLKVAYGMMPIQTIVPTLLSRKAIATLPTNPQQFTILRSTNTLLILKTIR